MSRNKSEGLDVNEKSGVLDACLKVIFRILQVLTIIGLCGIVVLIVVNYDLTLNARRDIDRLVRHQKRITPSLLENKKIIDQNNHELTTPNPPSSSGFLDSVIQFPQSFTIYGCLINGQEYTWDENACDKDRDVLLYKLDLGISNLNNIPTKGVYFVPYEYEVPIPEYSFNPTHQTNEVFISSGQPVLVSVRNWYVYVNQTDAPVGTDAVHITDVFYGLLSGQAGALNGFAHTTGDSLSSVVSFNGPSSSSTSKRSITTTRSLQSDAALDTINAELNPNCTFNTFVKSGLSLATDCGDFSIDLKSDTFIDDFVTLSEAVCSQNMTSDDDCKQCVLQFIQKKPKICPNYTMGCLDDSPIDTARLPNIKCHSGTVSLNALSLDEQGTINLKSLVNDINSQCLQSLSPIKMCSNGTYFISSVADENSDYSVIAFDQSVKYSVSQILNPSPTCYYSGYTLNIDTSLTPADNPPAACTGTNYLVFYPAAATSPTDYPIVVYLDDGVNIPATIPTVQYGVCSTKKRAVSSSFVIQISNSLESTINSTCNRYMTQVSLRVTEAISL